MIKIIKEFFKPSRQKIVLFLALFLMMFFEAPFIKSSIASGTKSLFWLSINYSGQKEDLSIVSSGFLIYFLAAYFISSLVISLLRDFKGKIR